MSRAWYFTALIPLAIGAVIGFFAIGRLFDQIEGMHRMVVPGERTLTLDAGEYIIYGESQSVVDGTAYSSDGFSMTCSATAKDGTAIALETYSGKSTYSVGGFSGSATFEFDVESSGPVKLACTSQNETKFVVAVGKGLGWSILGGVLSALVGFLSAIAVFAIVLAKRHAYKLALADKIAKGNR